MKRTDLPSFEAVVKATTHQDGREMAILSISADKECALMVPFRRLPQAARKIGAKVRVFVTKMYGHFGVRAIEDEPQLQPSKPARDVF